MRIRNGVQKVRPDQRDLSHHRTFGAIVSFPDEYNVDAGFPIHDQNAEGMPNGCTGVTQSGICADQDKVAYKPQFTYFKTQLMEGTEGQDVGCDIRDSLKSTIVYGVQAVNETTDLEATTHRRGAYYSVESVGDMFDGIRSALLKSGSVSMATAWFQEFESTQIGVISDIFVGAPSSYHNWRVCGWKQINGVPYLIGETHQGINYGDMGFAYFSRATINKLLDMSGTGAFVLDKKVDNPANIQLSIYEVILSYLLRIRAILTG